ncbi:MAG: hypothetical protein V7607_184 [Solirubrobacteraceae bacterium]
MTEPLRGLADRLVENAPPRETVTARLLDGVCALVRGADTLEGAAAARFGAGLRRHGWSHGTLDDVAVRTAIVRCSELDDIHMPSLTTPGSVVVPVAITVGAAVDAPAGDLAAAVGAGYEAMTRLGAAIGGPFLIERGIWPTAFTAAFAAAAATARLVGLDAGQTAEALAQALTRTTGAGGGVRGAALWRWLAVGDAARAGCLAALAAREGFRADLSLERFATIMHVELDEASLTHEAPAAIDAVSVKPYPCAKQCVAVTEAAQRLRTRVALGDVGAIRVLVPEAYAGMVARPPQDDVRLSRIASAAWNVALALAQPDALRDPDRSLTTSERRLAALARLVVVRADPELSRSYPARFPARLEIDAGGHTLVETVVDAGGDPGPGTTLGAVEDKWRGLLGPAATEWTRTTMDAAGGAAALRRLDETLRHGLAADPRPAVEVA